MMNFDNDGIDMDRVIVDPDYRRRVMARLRDERQHPKETDRTSSSSKMMSALPRDN
jgi:hypothetical protein